ncbi:MAG: MFS transporter [Dehalococcoidia bacterium]|uniref:MFS transporter n=1 Tax=Candidatus Amarobacter glycogenicus TaxID=3140699 RepID=UPI003136D2F9|nr:MFS transporter [Dehalococcoidia bacterium]MBK7125815.1 MFS transporter [Dehalococcoidia bacterium]MBK8559391.1 MFS transporter [Dehalococcoidia bacterium]MBK9546774.1 MFS transporter [Dehalococcoidia bacterium]
MTSASRSQRTLVLALLCVASFAVVFNNLIITPILPEISDDLGVRVAVAGLLVTAYAVAGGVAAIFSGPFIDRLGRKPVVVSGMAILTVATVASAFAPSYPLLMVARSVAGLGVACLTPAVFSAVGDLFSYEERGKAMSWVVSANTSASIFGVPAGAFLSGMVSWRWTFGVLAVLLAVFTWLIVARLPGDPPRPERPAGTRMFDSLGVVLRDVPAAMALFSNYLATVYWFIFTVYMGAYFHDEFGLAKAALGLMSAVMGLGVLFGSNIGGRLSDKVGKRPIIVWCSGICAVFISLVTTASPVIGMAIGFLFTFSLFSGARFASAQAVTTELVPEHRGTVMALNASGQQFGIVTGSLIGAGVLEVFGYRGLGPASGAVALLSLVTYALYVDEKRFTPAPAPNPA